MSLTVNLYYTGKNGSARKFAEEMESSGVADRIRQEPGNEKYDYVKSMIYICVLNVIFLMRMGCQIRIKSLLENSNRKTRWSINQRVFAFNTKNRGKWRIEL